MKMVDPKLDEGRRKEVRKILEETFKENEELDKKVEEFLDDLENGDLKKLLDSLKEKLESDKNKLSGKSC